MAPSKRIQIACKSTGRWSKNLGKMLGAKRGVKVDDLCDVVKKRHRKYGAGLTDFAGHSTTSTKDGESPENNSNISRTQAIFR